MPKTAPANRRIAARRLHTPRSPSVPPFLLKTRTATPPEAQAETRPLLLLLDHTNTLSHKAVSESGDADGITEDGGARLCVGRLPAGAPGVGVGRASPREEMSSASRQQLPDEPVVLILNHTG
ncbi:hypothetical protein OJAV_G00092280 [Oryzias javanicus]|uniref:Uncharacterized protein n=1 Tax=Oryzias javanicus TaxID=123683 RepID=A0A437D131_ORYJA|nr:hypothetical protein OJAV_G00092280 [Oryzias javanicus]